MLEDLRLAFRVLVKERAFSVVTVLTLAVAIGANTAIFSVVDGVLLRPLPYLEPDRIVSVAAGTLPAPGRTGTLVFSDRGYWHFVENNRVFESFGGYSGGTGGQQLSLTGEGPPVQVDMSAVTASAFQVLGTQPMIGRLVTPEEDVPGGPRLVVLSHRFFTSYFGGDESVIGRTIDLSGTRAEVIGVMPRGFAYPAGSDVWVSARALPDGNARTAHNYFVIGRLLPGVAIETAHADIGAIVGGLKRQFPGPYQTEDAAVERLDRHLVGSARPALLLLLAAVGVLLLLVAVNVANLLLVQSAVRARDLAVRTALGAGRRDLLRLLLAESLGLAGAGGAGGLLLAWWSMDLLRVLLPSTLPRGAEAAIDAGVVAFTVAVSLVIGIFFGAWPAWRGSRPDMSELLKSRSSPARQTRRMQSLLVVSEVALSLVLVAGAALLLDSFARLQAVDAGFTPRGVLAVSLSFPVRGGEVARLPAYYRDLLDRVRALPGVEHAGIIKDLPLDPIQRSGNFLIEGRARETAFEAGYLVATPGMMEALGIPIVSGRAIADADAASAPAAVVINRAMARRFWPDRDPIGQRIWVNSFEPKERWMTIVGIAGDVRQRREPPGSPRNVAIRWRFRRTRRPKYRRQVNE